MRACVCVCVHECMCAYEHMCTFHHLREQSSSLFGQKQVYLSRPHTGLFLSASNLGIDETTKEALNYLYRDSLSII